MVRADLAGSVAMSVPRPKHSYMALFKLGTSRKCQIFCPWTGYFLGFGEGDIPGRIKLILPLLAFLQSWEFKANQVEALLILITAPTALIVLEIPKLLLFGSLSVNEGSSVWGSLEPGVPGAPFAALPTPWQGSWMFAEVEAAGNSGQKSSGRCNDWMNGSGFSLGCHKAHSAAFVVLKYFAGSLVLKEKVCH